MTTTITTSRRAAGGVRSRCGVRDGSGVRLTARTDPARRVWSRRFFRYSFDPEREIPADDPASPGDARATIRRALDTWAKAGVGITFREVDLDDDPDLVFEWVPAVHSASDGDHDTLADVGTNKPIAHCPYPPRLDQQERVRFVCFDQDESDWDVVADANGDGRADIAAGGPEDIESVTVHEIGHFLGIEHLPGTLTVMYEFANGQLVLQPDDLAALRELYPPQGPVRFSAIWAEGSVERRALAWPPEDGTVFPGVPADDLADAIEEAQGDGWQPTRINAYEIPEGRFYSVVMDRASADRPWIANRSEDEFLAEHAEQEAAGFRLMSVDTFRGGERWNAVWSRDGAIRQLLRAEGDPKIVTEMIENIDGARPVSITGYVDADGVHHWAAVMWRNHVPARVRLARTREEMRWLTDEMREDGFFPFDIGTYVVPNGGGERWNAIYVQAPSTFANFRARGQYDAPNEITRYESQDLDAFNLNAFVRPAPLATTHVAAHEVSPPAPPPGTTVVTMGVAVDDHRVYATRYVQRPLGDAAIEPDGTLVALDRTTMAELAVTTVGHRPRRVAVNPTTGRIYVANWGQRSFSVSVVDGTTMEVVATLPIGQAPGPVAVNPATNRVYVTSWFQGVVHVIDGDTDQLLAPIPLGGRGPLGIAVDPDRDQVYVTIVNRSFAPFRNGLMRVTDHGRGTPAVEPFVDLPPLAAQASDVVFDDSRDRVYVANLGGGSEHPSIHVLHRAGLDVLAKVNVPGPVRAIALNSDADEVYGAGDRGTGVFDATTGAFARLLDERPSWGIAAAGGTARQLFLAERSGSITRLNP